MGGFLLPFGILMVQEVVEWKKTGFGHVQPVGLSCKQTLYV